MNYYLIKVSYIFKHTWEKLRPNAKSKINVRIIIHIKSKENNSFIIPIKRITRYFLREKIMNSVSFCLTLDLFKNYKECMYHIVKKQIFIK